MEDYINLQNVKRNGKRINWEESVGCEINGCYKNKKYNFIIEDYKSDEKYGYIYITVNNVSDWIRTAYVKRNVLQQFINPLPEYKFEIGDNIKGKNRDLTIINRYRTKYEWNGYTYNKKLYDCHCNKCGYDSLGLEEKDLHKKAMCKCCRGTILVKGINDVASVYPESIKYFQGGYQEAQKYKRGSQEKIYPVCPICGRVSTRQHCVANIARKGFSCICRDGFSYPEKYLYNILEQLELDFIYQATKANVQWIQNDFRYDFYIPNKRIIIETDGRQHKEDAWKTTASQVQENDKNKEQLAIKNNIKVIRIDADMSNGDYMKESIVKSEMQNYFDLSNIDYDKANNFASNKSIVVEVCKYKKENPLCTTGDIVKKFKISNTTVVRYLRIGENLGLIDKYIPHQHPKATTYQRGKAREVNSKEVYQFTMEGIFVKKYSSIVYAAKCIGGDPSNLSQACRRTANHKSYKGYLWSFTEICEPYDKGKRANNYLEKRKKVIELYKNNDSLSSKKISRIVGVSDTTVNTYLKQAGLK